MLGRVGAPFLLFAGGKCEGKMFSSIISTTSASALVLSSVSTSSKKRSSFFLAVLVARRRVEPGVTLEPGKSSVGEGEGVGVGVGVGVRLGLRSCVLGGLGVPGGGGGGGGGCFGELAPIGPSVSDTATFFRPRGRFRDTDGLLSSLFSHVFSLSVLHGLKN